MGDTANTHRQWREDPLGVPHWLVAGARVLEFQTSLGVNPVSAAS